MNTTRNLLFSGNPLSRDIWWGFVAVPVWIFDWLFDLNPLVKLRRNRASALPISMTDRISVRFWSRGLYGEISTVAMVYTLPAHTRSQNMLAHNITCGDKNVELTYSPVFPTEHARQNHSVFFRVCPSDQPWSSPLFRPGACVFFDYPLGLHGSLLSPQDNYHPHSISGRVSVNLSILRRYLQYKIQGSACIKYNLSAGVPL